MEVGSSISRRTRKRSEAYWDEYYRQRYNEIKKKSDQESYGNEGSTYVVVQDPDYSDKSSDDDDGDEWDCQHMGKKGSRKATRRTKKSTRLLDAETQQSFETKNEDSDHSDKSSVDDDDDNDDNDDDGDWEYENAGKKGSRKAGKPVKKKARFGGIDFNDMLEDLRLKEKDLIRVSADIVEENVVTNESYTLPLKFCLEDDEKNSCLVKKTDWEKEIDSLFDDLEMGLWESELAEHRNSSIRDDECFGSEGVDESPLAQCRQGEHDPFLDEQIGIVCKSCLSVLKDIKYVLPPFHVEASEKHERKNVGRSKNTIMDQIQFQNSNSGNLESSVHSKGTVFDLVPDSDKELYPHQLEGFEFLWRNIAGEINIRNLGRLDSDKGKGCIISHAPGTGKTRLTIVFLHTFLKLYPNCRPLIVAPCGMLLTWEQELKYWKTGINFHNLNEPKLSDGENETFSTVFSRNLGCRKDNDSVRLVKLLSWMKGGSVLGIGYRLFEELAGENKESKFKNVLLELPGLLVMDEGHTPRNNQSLMWKALTKVRTRRRVILSGTPFQNNFSELYNTLCLVNPTFSHQFTRKPGRKRKGKDNAGSDQWNILTNSIGRKSSSDDALKKLRSMIEPFVHIHKGSILQNTLHGMKDCLIILKPTDLQRKLLQNISKVEKYLEQAHLASLISIHPSLVAKKPEFTEHARILNDLKSDPNAGVKTHFLANLIQLSTLCNEKVLIFSEFIPPLLHIKSLLKSHFKWNEGQEIMYMDGDIGLKQRQHLITSFNDKKGRAKVMLASQRACSEGINLVGASRVVLLDVAWNPSVERQAICRAYRIGQERMVYVYHLVTMMEVRRYERQVEKERISELIFSQGGSGGGGGGFSSNGGVEEDGMLEAMVRQGSVGSMIEKIIHQPKESDFVNTFGFIDASNEP